MGLEVFIIVFYWLDKIDFVDWKMWEGKKGVLGRVQGGNVNKCIQLEYGLGKVNIENIGGKIGWSFNSFYVQEVGF